MELTDISNVLEHCCVCCYSNKELKFRVRCAAPEEDYENRQYHSTHGIKPPRQFTPSNTREHTKPIDEQVITVIFPQNAHLTVLIPYRPAVQKQTELRRKSNADGDDGGEVEVICVRTAVLGNCAYGLDDDDYGDGDHERAEGEVAGGFDTRFSGGEFPAVYPRDGAIAHY